MKRSLILNTVLALVSTIATLGVAEVFYDAVIPEKNRYSVSSTGNQYTFYQYDSLLGWTNRPGMKGTFKREEFSYTIAINQYGMRQSEISPQKAPGKMRIALLGDSFPWGIGVPDSQRITENMERFLKNTEVLNFAVSGYSPIQYYLMIDSVAKFLPDIVIILFCLGNDFSDNVMFLRYGYYGPYVESSSSGGFVVRGQPVPDVRKFGIRANPRRLIGSRLLGDLYTRVERVFAQDAGLKGFDSDMIYASDSTLTREQMRLKQKAIELNQLLLGAIKRRCDELKVRLLVVSAPTKREYNSSAVNQNGYCEEAERILASSCNKEKIAFLPTVSLLHKNDFWQLDPHWNAVGHWKMAKAVVNGLVERGFLSPSKNMRESGNSAR